ncbi:hypothetical protein Alg130_11534 [Pyrenophora tritici-repentis]|nr:hypothetical protein Alg130_11534 [Pyrenophora tritici-repentis]
MMNRNKIRPRRRGRLHGTSPKEVLKRALISSWENDEPRIDEIYEDDSGFKGRVTWGDLEVVTYPAMTLYTRCPRKVFSYYEGELRRLRAEQISTGQISQQWLYESISEISAPETPVRASQSQKEWKAPKPKM